LETLPPYPNGWYAVGFSDELPRRRVISRRFMGAEIVLYRTASGVARAVDAHCPHLGAHLGVGGRVDGEVLVCPFHGFAYGDGGTCVRTGYGTKPPAAARLREHELRETNGILLVHHDSAGCPPGWVVPELDSRGWTQVQRRTFELRDHPQETTENSVDIGHFAFVHDYRDATLAHEAEVDGPHLKVGVAARRRLPYIGRVLRDRRMSFQFDIDIWGLGYSLVHVHVPALRLDARLWVLATPIDERSLTLRMAASVRKKRPGIAYGLLGWFMLSSLAHDAQQDFPIWENKRYVDKPALAAGDGPIGLYRRWAKQFYG